MFNKVTLDLPDCSPLNCFVIGSREIKSDCMFSPSDELGIPAMARLYLDRYNGLLYKFTRSGKRNGKRPGFIKYLQNYLNNCIWLSPAAREYRGNATLKKIGLRVPRRVGVAFPSAFRTPYSSIYVQSYIEGAVTLEHFLETVKDTVARKGVLGLVAADIIRIYKARVFYRDLHFRNVLIEGGNRIFWVDTTVKRFVPPWRYRKKMKRRVENFVEILRQYTDITEEELDGFWGELPVAIGGRLA